MSPIDVIRKSKLYNYTDIMSDEEVIKAILTGAKPTGTSGNREFIKELTDLDEKKDWEIINTAADLLQSITNSARTTKDIVKYLYENHNENSLELLGTYLKIVHAENYEFTYKDENGADKKEEFANTPFAIEKENLTKDKNSNLYSFNDTYGLYNTSSKANQNQKQNQKQIYDIETILLGKQDSTKSSQSNTDDTKGIVVNNCDGTGTNKLNLIENKLNTSMSFILIDSPDIKIGTRNSIELSTYFNLLSTVELSKCMPYFDATFLIPVLSPPSAGRTNQYRSASITQFLKGETAEQSKSDYHKVLDNSYSKKVGNKSIEGVDTNMSLFTTPQTLNYFDEVMIGHNENIEDYLFKERVKRRPTSIHDITRPFMTIKSFNIDVAPTQGLMSFKTGKISLTIHDRTRMQDISAFVKPDMFGSFGSEIIVEYGWANIDALNEEDVKILSPNKDLVDRNYLGDFLNKSRVVEKYIITNSSFSMDNNGQINVDLSIAARGPVDIRNVVFKTNTFEAMTLSAAKNREKDLKQKIKNLSDVYGVQISSGIFSSVYSEVGRDYRDTQDMENMFESSRKLFNEKISKNNSTTKYKKIRKYVSGIDLKSKDKEKPQTGPSSIKLDTKLSDIINEFNEFTRDMSGDVHTDMPSIGVSFFVGPNAEDPSGKTSSAPGAAPIEFGQMTVRDLYLRGKYEKEQAQSVLTTTTATNPTPAAGPAAPPANQNQTTTSTTNKEQLFLNDFITALHSVLYNSKKVYNNYTSIVAKRLDKVNDVVNKIMGGLNDADPFYNKEFTERYNRIILNINTGGNSIPVNSINEGSGITTKKVDKVGTKYVSFGSFLTGLIGSHLTSTGKFDEIQIVSYTVNPYAGLFANLNVASLLINRKDLYDYLKNLFLEGGEFTVESIVSQVVNEFLLTRTSINYGLNKFYRKDKNGTTKAVSGNIKLGVVDSNQGSKKIEIRIKDTQEFQSEIGNLIKIISLGLEDAMTASTYINLKKLIEENKNKYSYLDVTKFVLPKIKITFDTLTSKENKEKTICRISVYDQSNNPFGSISDIMEDLYNKNIGSLAHRINLAQREFNTYSKNTDKKRNISQKVRSAHLQKLGSILDEFMYNKEKTDEIYGEENTQLSPLDKFATNPVKLLPTKTNIPFIMDNDSYNSYIDKLFKTPQSNSLLNKRIPLTKSGNRAVLDVEKDNDGNITKVKIISDSPIAGLKARYKSIMPSITYGSQNSALIEASVTTVNESKLNTVYLTRNYTSKTSEETRIKAIFDDELPLRIVPAQASITMFGCPFVNFAQYVFLDFETGTTLDNTYFVTGIKHDLTPGKFTTQLTLSYGDIYGKYENIASTISKAFNDISEAAPSTKSITPPTTKNPEVNAPASSSTSENKTPKTKESNYKLNDISKQTFLIYYLLEDKTLIWPSESNIGISSGANLESELNKKVSRKRAQNINSSMLSLNMTNDTKNKIYGERYRTCLSEIDVIGSSKVSQNKILPVKRASSGIESDSGGLSNVLVYFFDKIYYKNTDENITSKIDYYTNLSNKIYLSNFRKKLEDSEKKTASLENINFNYTIIKQSSNVEIVPNLSSGFNIDVRVNYNNLKKSSIQYENSIVYNEECDINIDIKVIESALKERGKKIYFYIDLLSSPFFVNRNKLEDQNFYNTNNSIIKSIKDFKKDIQLLNKYKIFGQYFRKENKNELVIDFSDFFYNTKSSDKNPNVVKNLDLLVGSGLYNSKKKVKNWKDKVRLDSLAYFHYKPDSVNEGYYDDIYFSLTHALKHEFVKTQNAFLERLKLGSYSNPKSNCSLRQRAVLTKSQNLRAEPIVEIEKKVLYFKKYKEIEDLVKAIIEESYIFTFDTSENIISHGFAEDTSNSSEEFETFDVSSEVNNNIFEINFNNVSSKIKNIKMTSKEEVKMQKRAETSLIFSPRWSDVKVEFGEYKVNNKKYWLIDKNKTNKYYRLSVKRNKIIKGYVYFDFDRCISKMIEIFLPLEWDELYFEDKDFTIKKHD